MLACQNTAKALFQSNHLNPLFSDHIYQFNLLSEIVEPLGHRDGHANVVLRIARDVDVGDAVVHPHNLEEDVADLDELPAGIATAGEELLIDTLANDADFAFLPHILFGDVTAIPYVGGLYLRIHGFTPANLTVRRSGTDRGGLAPPGHFRRDRCQLRYHRLEPLHVLGRQHNVATLLETLVGLGCAVGIDNHGIGGEALEVLLQHTLHAFAAAH